MSIDRLKNDLRLTLILMFGVLTITGITPFVIYRFASGQWAAGLLDIAIQAGIGAAVLYAWRGGDVDRAGLLVAVFCSTGCVAVGQVMGLPGALWLYPVLLANFLLAARSAAAILSVLTVALVSATDALGGAINTGTFVVTAAMVAGFAYIFSYRTEEQRRLLEGVAAMDPLTGALNRRGLDDELDAAMAEAMRTGSPVGLAVLDLDGFKQVNDENGHEAGDAVLLEFAGLVRELTRKSDRFFRLGGDEFALLVPGADADAMSRIAQAVRHAVQNRIAGNGQPVTVSIGATIMLPGDTPGSWLHRADTAMYRAKREGSNRVVVSCPPPAGEGQR
ncbi:GGDEF domain-containing protein [Novilysobacter spongiicola]|uniref:diguanylate cyclase n=1 Tax=Lysobacter spongiicola DSM 21749 TaxID=1122188 RepID=A0A1T4Q2C3_9GAMM|nr:GGDEF domain-containing protein [Lysobacter spongiicola]SJZ97879.1 diguanylate cyclase (GGDEF) domain-containing protein [Lysobacter spongiicola DSM 21749]